MTKFYLSFSRYLTVLLMLLSTVAWSQSRTVTGLVTSSEDGAGLPGVNVVEKGTSNGTVTDVNGNYSLKVNDNATLVFSFVGYTTQEASVGSQGTINIKLASDVTALSEVVVVGYGQQEKRDVTGAMSSIASEQFNKGVITSPDQLFQGKAAGVQITSSSGEPGAGVNITIRGASSFRSGNNPLIVIDGFPIDTSPSGASAIPASSGQSLDDAGLGSGANKNPLNFLNPSDIKSIEILKDASATAIYGSRGANGVILITTKKGQKGKGTVTYDVFVGTSALPSKRKIDLISGSDYPSKVTAAGGDATATNYGGSTDWQDQIYRTGTTQGHSLSFGGGNEKTTYRASLSYLDQDGIVKNSNMKRYTARINGNHSFIADKLKMDFQLSVANTANVNVPISNNAGFQGSLIGAALQANPTLPVRHTTAGQVVKDGKTYTWNAGDFVQLNELENGQAVSQDFRNPVAMLAYINDREQNTRILGNVGLTWNISKHLEYRINAGVDNSTSVRRVFYDPRLKLGGNFDNYHGRATMYHRYLTSPLIENYLTYKTQLSGSEFTALVGHSYQKFNNQGDYVGVQNLPSGEFFIGYNNITSGTSPDKASNPFGSDNQSSALQSFYARLNYNIADKYLLTATVRADGSSKFGSDNRYGVFPSVAAGWRLSEEAFIPDAFQDLKLRAGWGITGNQLGLPPGISKAQYQVNAQTGGLQLVSTPNPGIKWEQTRQLNIGLDYGILGGRLSGAIDYFNKNTTDLLLQLSLAQPAPTQYAWQNLPANVINSGIEFTIDGVIVDNHDVKFSTNFNYTYFIDQAVVKNLGTSFYNTGVISGQGLSGAYSQRIVNNQTLGEFFMQQYTGLNEAGAQTFANDGKLAYVGSPQPKSIVGLTFNLSYKRFDMSLGFNGRFGAYVYNNTANALYLKGSLRNGRNVSTEVGNSTESPNEAPIVSTRYLEKGDFIRLNNLSLGYNFSNLNVSWLSNVRLYVTGQNLLLITKYNGYDPEINTDKNLNGVPSVGIDYTSFPRPRTLTAGLTVTF